VIDGRYILKSLFEGLEAEEITDDDFDIELSEPIDPARAPDEAPNLIALANQMLNEMTPDEACGPRDERFHLGFLAVPPKFFV